MRPDSRAIIDSVIASLDAYVLPRVEDEFAKSILKTTTNLLRHVQIRIAEEPALLHADCVDLATTLSDVRAMIRAAPAFADALALDRVVDVRTDGQGELLPLDLLQARWDELNDALDTLLQRLSQVRGRFADDAVYVEVRRTIRAYLARHLEREDRLISPAFTGGRR